VQADIFSGPCHGVNSVGHICPVVGSDTMKKFVSLTHLLNTQSNVRLPTFKTSVGYGFAPKSYLVVGVEVLFLPPIFLARQLRNGEENEQALREREKERKREARKKKIKKKRLTGIIVNFQKNKKKVHHTCTFREDCYCTSTVGGRKILNLIKKFS
jgi:hypothetical protein